MASTTAQMDKHHVTTSHSSWRTQVREWFTDFKALHKISPQSCIPNWSHGNRNRQIKTVLGHMLHNLWGVYTLQVMKSANFIFQMHNCTQLKCATWPWNIEGPKQQCTNISNDCSSIHTKVPFPVWKLNRRMTYFYYCTYIQVIYQHPSYMSWALQRGASHHQMPAKWRGIF